MTKRILPSIVVSAFLGLASAPLFAGAVVINEIHYEPADKTKAEEFLELHNAGETEVELSGWFFSDGIAFTFPAGAKLAPGAYRVLAEDPEALKASFGFEGALGPYEGQLRNDGERIVLRNAAGGIEDEVDYRAEFPWPLASEGQGSSMELIHPRLDNDLAGSWRASKVVIDWPLERVTLLAAGDGGWRYLKATAPPSEPPEAWRQPEFVEDESWAQGPTPIGFGDDDDATLLEDMQGLYMGVFIRNRFRLESPGDLPRALLLRLYVDDGAVVWVNGREINRHRAPAGELAFDAKAARGADARWEEFLLLDADRFLVHGENTIAIHALNFSLTSNDFSIDAELVLPAAREIDAYVPPSPGRRNSVYAETAPPQIRQVEHEPQQPKSGESFAVRARVSDPEGVAEVRLFYQVVLPGKFVPAFLSLPHNVLLSQPNRDFDPNPEFEDPANWVSVPMLDDGQGADALAGDGIVSAAVPGQINRTLVRYRIAAADGAGASVRVPYDDDPSLNFACFVYDGIPPYAPARASVLGPGHVYSAELMSSLPVYFLLTRAEEMAHCLAYNPAFQIPKASEDARDRFNWEGAFVYDGQVYDHIHYRLRQANDRYGTGGKRSMRIRFHRGRYIQLHDDYGRPYPRPWRTINTGKGYDNRRFGNFGLTETMNAILWNKVGVPAPWFHFFHFRVIDQEKEVPDGPLGQHTGDFWGFFNAIEDYDPRFLEAHGMPDGNLYKLKDGIFNGNLLRRNQGRFAVTTDQDFQNIRANLRPQRDDAWLDEHVNYPRWYPYHAVVEGIRHYDFVPADSHSKNRAWFFEPAEGSQFGRLWTLPWDSDASWGPNWNEGIDYSKNAIFAGRKDRFKQGYRNFIREFRDLLWNEETMTLLIDETASFVRDFSSADRDRWRGAPAAEGVQDFGAIDVKIRDMKNFALVGWSAAGEPAVPAGGRARHLENLANAEGDAAAIPRTPTVASASPEGFPVDALRFTASPFSDPQGDDGFAAMKWRLGEVEDPEAPGFAAGAPPIIEWDAVWETEELSEYLSEISIPRSAVRVGHRYRVRVKMKDLTEKWSHWSAPLEFVAGAPLAPSAEETSLRITEIHYHPQGDTDLEFIEVQNIGERAVELHDVEIREGIQFSFRDGAIGALGPSELAVVVKNLALFKLRYGGQGIPIAGEYLGRLSNAGDRVSLVYRAGSPILELVFDDAWYPQTDGQGFSLVIRDAGSDPAAWSLRESWRPSAEIHGSPGRGEGAGGGGRQRPGDLDQDGKAGIADVIAYLRHLFLAGAAPLPCGDGSIDDLGNRRLIDLNGDGAANLADAVHLLDYLFRRGAPPASGTACVPIAGCPEACRAE